MIELLSFGRWRPLWLLLALAGSALGAAAQTNPVPTVPTPEEEAPEDVDESGESSPPAPGTAADSTTAPAWEYSLGGGLGWENNVGLQVSTAPSDYSALLRGQLARVIRTPRSELRLSGRGTGYFYREQTDYNRADAEVALDASWRLSTRTTGSLGLSVSYDHSDTSAILEDQGILLPVTRTLAYAGSIGLSRRFSSRTTVRASVVARRLELPESSRYQDSNSLRATVALDRRLDARDTLSWELSSESSQAGTDGESFWTHYASSQWRRVLTSRSALLVEGGASYTPEYGSANLGRAWSFFGGAAYTRAIRGSRITATYRREVLPVFGAGGLRLADRFGLGANLPLGSEWELRLGGGFTREAQTHVDDERQSRLDASASLGRRLFGDLSVSAEGRYYRQTGFFGVPGLDTVRVGVFFELTPRRR